MELNIKNFTVVMKKATVNHMNDYCQLTFENNKIKCSLINQEQNLISRLNIDDDIFDELDESLELNMSIPEVNIIPYLQLFDSETVDVEYTKMRNNIVSVLKLKEGDIQTKINLSEPVISRYFSKNPSSLKSAFKIEVDSVFKESFDKIKKIASRTNKIYFVSEKNRFYLESGDRSVPYINSVRVDMNADCSSDFASQYQYKNVHSLLSVLSEEKDYYLELLTNGKANISYIYDEDKTEEYYILPQQI